jgi:hypothetical protein
MISRRLVPLVIVAALAAVACSPSAEVSVNTAGAGASSGAALAQGALDAARYRQPTFLTDVIEPGTALDRIGHLLVGDVGRRKSYVDADHWCTGRSGNCVIVGESDGDLEFDGVPIDEFELDTTVEVTPGADLEVVAVHALHHPVDDVLTMSIDLRSETQPWTYRVDLEPSLTIDGTDREAFIDGPYVMLPGSAHRFGVGIVGSVPLTGSVELRFRLVGGDYQGDPEATVTVTIDEIGPSIERRPSSADAASLNETYRSDLDLGADTDGSAALAELIDALVAGDDAIDLVAPDSPAAAAVNAIAGLGPEAAFVRDADDPSGVCWTTRQRGTFCERWRVVEVVDSRIVSWEIEDTPLADIATERIGSLPGSRVSMLALPVGRVVVGSVTVRNDSATELSIDLYSPTVIADDLAVDAIDGDGEIFIEPLGTERGWFMTPTDRLDVELRYRLGYGLEQPPLVFAADASAPSSEDGPLDAPEAEAAAAIRLVSLLGEEQYDEAAALAAPGSEASTYLDALADLLPDAYVFATPGSGPTEMCLQSLDSLGCNEIVVNGLDGDGLITSLGVGGRDASELVVVDRAGGDEQFELVVDRAVLWPDAVTVVEWTLTNNTDADVLVETISTVDTDLVQTEPAGGVFAELFGGRAITDVSAFDGDVLDQALEIRGTGREAIVGFVAVAFMGEPFDGMQSEVESEASTTDFETRGGRTLTIPGAWRQYVFYDDATGELVGTGMPLGPPKSLRRGNLVLMTFSPPFSPLDSTPDELLAAFGEFADLDPALVERSAALAEDGRESAIMSGEIELVGDRSQFIAIPGPEEFFVVTTVDPLGGFDGLAEIVPALIEIAGLREA